MAGRSLAGMVPTYREQVNRWLQGAPSRAQREVLSRLSKDVDQLEQVVRETREIVQELAAGISDAVRRMDDSEPGTAGFEQRILPPSGTPPNEALRHREMRGIAVVLDEVGRSLTNPANLLDRLAAVAPHLALFQRLMHLGDEEEINMLCLEHPGLYRFARTMEEAAALLKS
jgi:hypothetical protein